MPKGPNGEKRPANVIGNAVKVIRITLPPIHPSLTPLCFSRIHSA